MDSVLPCRALQQRRRLPPQVLLKDTPVPGPTVHAAEVAHARARLRHGIGRISGSISVIKQTAKLT